MVRYGLKRKATKILTGSIVSLSMVFGGFGWNIAASINGITVAKADDEYYTKDGFSYEIIDDSYVEITGYNGDYAEVVIPEKIDGYEVRSIGGNAFDGCSSLTSIEIPSSVESIGYGAFWECSSLMNIKIPTSVTSIENYAFFGCSSITNIEIPSSVTSIESGVFSGCSSLTGIEIPSSVMSIGYGAFSECSSITNIEIPLSVTSIGDGAFSECSSLNSIVVDKANKRYDSRNNCNAIIETESNTLIAGSNKTIIPSSVMSIGDRAFSGCNSITSIEIPSSVMSIGYGAFSGCNSITNIKIPTSVTSIENYAFSRCYSITSIEIPSSVTSIESGVFWECSSLTGIEIPTSVTSIGDFAFFRCSSITSIEIPSSVTSIGDYVFGECSSITSIEIPSSVTSIEKDTFRECSSLTSIEIPTSVTYVGDCAFDGCSSLTSIEIPSSVTSIGYGAFSGCSSLTSIEIPTSVTSIGYGVFSGCSSLNSIVVDKANKRYDSRNNCNAIIETATNALKYGCKNTKIPLSVTNIEYTAFSGCSNLTSIEIPSSVTSIGYGAFSGCSSLNSIVVDKANKIYDSRNNCNAIIETESDDLIVGCNNTKIPSSVTSIEYMAFSGCGSLTSIEIPSSVTSIGDNVFWGCSSLTSIKIPSSVTYIGEWAFDGCSSLTSIEIPSSVRSIGDNAFLECDNLIIRCTKDSYAHQYAVNNHIPFELIEIHEHKSVTDPAVAPTCTKTGLTEGSHCSVCNEVIVAQKVVPATGHNYTTTTTKAVPGTNGSTVKKCSLCGDKIETTIHAPKTVMLSSTSFTYDGKVKKPTVTVKDNDNKVIAASNYDITYTNNKNVGTATVKVNFKGNSYSGSLSKTFKINKANNKLTGTFSYTKTASAKAQSFKLNVKATGGKIIYKSNDKNVKVDSTGKVIIAKNYSGSAIITIKAGNSNYKTVTKKVTITVKPAATTFKSVKNTTAKNASKGKLTVKWNKLSYVTGYQIQYSTSSSFKKGNKTVNVKGASSVSKAITGLAKNKTYYVRIRTYKTIDGKNVFSSWSAKKSIKIGK